MKPNKLEIQIREKLNSREMQPTPMAWDRLDAMLTVAEEKKSKKGINWLLIAACFIGVVVVGTLLYQLNSNEIILEDTVVNKEINSTKTEDSSTTVKQKINKEIVVPTVNNQVANATISTRKKSIINQKTNQKSTVIKNQTEEPKEVIATNYEQKEIKLETNIKIIPISVNPDKLLASVDVAKKQKTSKSTVKVNTTSLLAQAETEQNTNFKETRFQKLKRNFKSVKTAVTNRNNQE